MIYIKLQYKNGKTILDSGNQLIDLIRKYDLATKANGDVKIYQLDQESFILQSLQLEVSK